jgi:hypothetical protein
MLLNCLILIRCGKNGSHISPRNDDLLVGRPKVPPLPSLFESAVSMGALGKFEVVLGYVVEYVNIPSARELSRIILLVANPNVIERKP